MPFQFRQLRLAFGALAATLFAQTLLSQVAAKAAATSSSSSVQQAIQLATEGRCQEALPVLRKAFPHVVGKDFRYHATMATVRCAMDLQDDDTATAALLQLKREFSNDPEVLYIATHYFSEMGMRAARELTTKAPSSFQARKLQAEDLESEGKDEDAAAVYKKILEEDPKTQGIHYRLGQIALAQAGSDGSTDQAKVEFEKELEVDPHNAASEFILGELARRAGQWDEAIGRFTRASTLDIGFAEAYLALGMSLNASGKFPEAVKPLENYVKMQPGDPAGHYQLAMSYARTGNKIGSAQQLALQAKAATGQRGATDTTEGHVVIH
jgi:tetratricopeptide (TPR) repeat protein